MRNPRGVRRQGTDVVAPLTADLCADAPLALDDREALQIRPLVGLVEAIDRVERPATSHFRSTVAVLVAQGSRSYANDIDFWLLCSHLNFAILCFVEMC